MKKILRLTTIALSALCLGFTSCSDDEESSTQPQPKGTYQFLNTQEHTAIVNWDPKDYNFKDGNTYYMEYYAKAEEALAGGCSSWRNGNFHGRNLDWNQANFGCLVIRMPKGNGVKHASVSTLNGSKTVSWAFINNGTLTPEQKKYLPCVVVDGINDAGVAVNINIVPHDPQNTFIGKTEGDLSSQCVVRYVLDNAGSVQEALDLLGARTIRQSIVGIAGDETHYMISDPKETAVVEFINREMKVTRYTKQNDGFYSPKGNPAIMTNMYDYAIEQFGFGNEAMFDAFPYGMGVERWGTIRDQYASAKQSVEANVLIAKSVWYFDNFMAKKTPWYTENAISTVYGKDTEGWWYKPEGEGTEKVVRAANHKDAIEGFYQAFMTPYWENYDNTFGKMADPHVDKNAYWETSHSVIYDVDKKMGYLYPFENRYVSSEYPRIELLIP